MSVALSVCVCRRLSVSFSMFYGHNNSQRNQKEDLGYLGWNGAKITKVLESQCKSLILTIRKSSGQLFTHAY